MIAKLNLTSPAFLKAAGACMIACLSGLITIAQEAQPGYSIDISPGHGPLLSNHLKLGTNINPRGEILDANSLYFTRNNKPWLPVMGEFHFTRFPKEQWESSLLKMKGAGIEVIATYIFWIYHEEEEGKWDWNNNRDLRSFASLCAKHGLFLFIRIGPWCHGEVRNGGFPDWLLKKPFKPRTNDPAYLGYVTTLFSQVHQQLKGLYFKDGGPVIGAQMENEYRFNNPKGLEHILALKQIAVAAGIDVPYYTATGWPGSDSKQTELLPVWGGYPEAPWDKRTTELPLSENYLFTTLRNDPAIGNDLLGTVQDTTNYSGYRYPYATAEMGAGIQITYHRRPIIAPDDVTSLAYAKIGSGANLIGYYMFHGGSNPVGALSTLQESKATKYPNDYPIINYDFQSPVGEWGELRPSYKAFKLLHYFLNDFGGHLATTFAFFPDKKPTGPADAETLRWSVRAGNNSGFIFISNFQRQLIMKDISGVQFHIKLKGGDLLKVPEQPVTIPAHTQMVWPFNMDLSGCTLRYATVQPLCCLQNGNDTSYVFWTHDKIPAEYVVAEKNIAIITATNARVEKIKGFYFIKDIRPGLNCIIKLKRVDGKTITLLTVDQQQALNSWKLVTGKKEWLCISDGEVIMNGSSVRLQSTGKSSIDVILYPRCNPVDMGKNCIATKKTAGIFTRYTINFPEKKIVLQWKQDHTAYIVTDSSASLPLYGTRFKPVASATYWKAMIPATILDGLSNAFLKIEYEGDTQGAYLDGKLIADDFYSGVPMTIGLNQFNSIPGKELTLLITALQDTSKIYFEKGIREPLVGKQVATIKRITVIPQYETVFRLQ